MKKVKAIRKNISIPTYPLGKPEKNPLFFEKRVYQGSCGKVYPLPFIDKVYDQKIEQEYDTIHLENDFIRLTLLPEIGGRIFLGQDKNNNDYDFFYRQDEIKPALVGLAGPWISGGVEFNWPQHHRPSTFMPTDVHIEQADDSTVTVWLSEHDPMNRMKGMHGISITPNSTLIELKGRLYNRTETIQSFLWWANIAVESHQNMQSFFPPDVHYVADHAVRAQSTFPHANSHYYGIDYGEKGKNNDLRRYHDIPVPTSYMICETDFDFFGAYDFDAQGGFIHVADKHIAPGKKQWTWGNHEFGWAWDRELADRIGSTGKPAPYIELMAGVYTDNQPDFSYIAPYETKTFSQFWWPYKKIGPVQNATKDAAVRLVKNANGSLELGAVSSRLFKQITISLKEGDNLLLEVTVDLSPNFPWHLTDFSAHYSDFSQLVISVGELVSYQPIKPNSDMRQRDIAKEPAMPADVDSIEELYLIAEHLELYRHPTRYPEIYWDEILARDPKDIRTNIAYGRRLFSLGQFKEAEKHLRTAISRLTAYHPNPSIGEAHYYLGLTLRFQNKCSQAYPYFYKAIWNEAYKAPGFFQLATLDTKLGNIQQALNHCQQSLLSNNQNNKAHVLKAILLKKLGQTKDAETVLKEQLEIDPLDHWARYQLGDIAGLLEKSRNDAQTMLDIAYDYADIGFNAEAIAVLDLHHRNPQPNIAVPNPLSRSAQTHYTLAWLKQCPNELNQARKSTSDYFFPSRLHDQISLEWAYNQVGNNSNEAYALGNFYFDKKRHQKAIQTWLQVSECSPAYATTCRNLGIAFWNIHQDAKQARALYLKAIKANPTDARIFSEYDQLREKLGDENDERLTSLLNNSELVFERDDCIISLVTLLNQTGRFEEALKILTTRRFHPWEGGEGKVVAQYTKAMIMSGQNALKANTPDIALNYFLQAMSPPENLGETYHLLQSKCEINYWQGKALRQLNREKEACERFSACINEVGDFKDMALTEHSESSYFRALALQEMNKHDEAEQLLTELKVFEQKSLLTPNKIDYFATSLPLMLVFEDHKNKKIDK